MNIPLTVDSLALALATALAESSELTKLTGETQAQAPLKVFLGFDMTLEVKSAPTPCIIILPDADTEETDGSRTITLYITEILRDNRSANAGGSIIIHSSAAIASRFAELVKSLVKGRTDGTDAKLLRFSTQYDFETVSANNIFMVKHTVTVPLPARLRGGYLI